MASHRFASRLLIFSTALLLSACGSRSALQGGDASSSDGGAGGGTSGTTSTTTTTGPLSCDGLTAQPNWLVVLAQKVSKPQLAAFPGTKDAFVAALSVDFEDQWISTMRLTDPWSTWPPVATGGKVADQMDDFVMSTGPQGPIALVKLPTASPTVFRYDPSTFAFEEEAFLSLQSGEPLFVAEIQGRTLGATGLTFSQFHELSIGSLQPGNLPQGEQPLLCTKTRTLADAVPSGTGFLAAIAEVDPIENDCIAGPDKAAALRVMVRRYESPSAPGSFVEMTLGDGVSNSEPIARLAMSPASFGAWVVFQTDGSTSEQMPAIEAFAVDQKGHILSPKGQFAVSPEGIDWPHLAAATVFGDRIAVAHVETFDTSAPEIVIEMYDVNGAKGPSISIPTGDSWLGGRIDMLPSPDGRSLLVAWEVSQDQPRMALTRVDCLTAL